MANHHFGNFGDLWKHLPLAELLALAHPARHWETHAGSALYNMTPSRGRDHGVNWYLNHAGEHRVARDITYSRLIHPLLTGSRRGGGPAPLDAAISPIAIVREGRIDTSAPASKIATYPGSPWLALAALADRPTQFIFCDLDDVSINSIRTASRHFHIDPDRLRTIRADGIATVSDALQRLNPADAPGVSVFIDPFRPEIASATLGINAFDLFVQAARRGCITLLWYGFHHEEAVAAARPPASGLVSREGRHDEIRRAIRASLPAGAIVAADAEMRGGAEGEEASLNAASKQPQRWCGEIILQSVFRAVHSGNHQLAVGIHGCGLLGANLPLGAVSRFRAVAAALVDIYATSTISDGMRTVSGALAYEEPPVIPDHLIT